MVAFHAITALCRAIPNCERLQAALTETGQVMVTVAFTTEAAALACAESFGIELTFAKGDTTTWLRGSKTVDGLFVYVFGPHREIDAGVPGDEKAVQAALDQVNAAIAEVTP